MITVEEKRQLHKIHSARWLMDFTLDWAFILFIFILVDKINSLWIWPVAAFLIGARLHALAILGHDATHKLALSHRFLNDAISEVMIAWPLFVVIDKGYRPWHFDHHRGLGSDHDPELNYRAADTYSGQATWLRIIRLFILDLIGFGIPELIRFILEVKPKSHSYAIVKPILFWLALVGISLYFHQGWIPLLWLYSIATGFWAIFRLRTFLEHVSVYRDGKENSHRFSAGPLARFFFVPHNTFCHYEHHKSPQVPYYHLPRLRALDSSVPILPMRELFPIGESFSASLSVN